MDESPVPAWEPMEAVAVTRWTEVLETVTDMLPGPDATVVVDGPPAGAEAFADRLAAALRATGQACTRLSDASPSPTKPTGGRAAAPERRPSRTVRGGGRCPPTVRRDVVIWLRYAGRR